VVTFLVSDLEGSTRLWEGDPEAMGAAIARHYELLDAAIVLHGGVRPAQQGGGDNVVGAFASPSDAVGAAVDAQRAFATEAWPLGCALRIRVALHTAQAQLRGGCYVGPALNRCARLRDVAHGGQTVLSAATHDLVADAAPEGVGLRDLGPHRLKDLDRPERVWQLTHPDLINDFPPLRSLDAVTNNLPAQLTSFVGRQQELVAIGHLLDEARLVTLTGAGGSGKTRLALHAAAEVVDRRRDGVWWVELGPVPSPDQVPYAVARACNLVEEEGRLPLDTLREQLAGLEALLVLDNCEHVLESCAQLVVALLRAAPGLRILVTSREPLAVPGEVTWRVPSLGDDTGARLFVERAAQVRPGFHPQGGEAQAVVEICRRLDGLPLAIELAAARVRMMAPSRIAARLADRFRLLTGGGRMVLPRQRTLETSVAWSHDLLDAVEQAVLRRLSVFAGGFTLEAAEQVCHDDDLERDDALDSYAVLDILSRLVDKSLVQADLDEGEGRYRLLETIRFFARERLLESGETELIRQRHRDFFLALAERAEPELTGSNGPGWLDRLEREHDNLRVALEWCQACEAHEPFLRLVTALTLFFELRCHLQAGGRWFARALAHDGGPSALRARALWGAAHVALYGEDYDMLTSRAAEAAAMARQVGDDWALGRILNTHGLAAALLGSEPETARGLLAASIALGGNHGDDWAVADGWKMMTIAWMVQDDYQGLAPALAELRQVSERLDNQFFIAWHHCTIGWVGLNRGEFAAAERSLREALAIDRVLGGAATAGIATALLGELEAATGRHDDAEARLRLFLSRASATGDGMGLPLAYLALGRLLLGRGKPEEAVALLEPLLQLLTPLGVPLYVSAGLSVLGAAHLAAGDMTAARTELVEANRLAVSIRNPRLGGQATHQLAELAYRESDHGRAEDLLHEALTLRATAGVWSGATESLEALATLAADRESPAEAARVFGAISALRAEMGLVRWPIDQRRYDTTLLGLRHTLGDDGFATAWAQGEALTLSEAVAYVSRSRGQRKRPSAGWASLTPTELEVVKLAAQGLTNPEIGARLFISRATVKTHLAHIFTKLGLGSRAELAAQATRRSFGL
jgi:predicted ATPase/class 3 adenylate cyclase/DNA-binding CsgD family transcriptional regulator